MLSADADGGHPRGPRRRRIRERVLVVALALATSGGLAACDSAREATATIDDVPDCAVLVRAARRASDCDANLLALAEELSTDPAEDRCRAVARGLLSQKRVAAATGVRSLHETEKLRSTAPLDTSERTALLQLPLPATLTIIPDLSPRPGVPPTTGMLDSVPLESDARGRLRGRARPGVHTMTVRHAGQETQHCIDLERCARLTVAAHGSTLAHHPRIKRGPCDGPRPAEVAPSSPVANR